MDEREVPGPPKGEGAARRFLGTLNIKCVADDFGNVVDLLEGVEHIDVHHVFGLFIEGLLLDKCTDFFGRFAFEKRTIATAHGDVAAERFGRGFQIEGLGDVIEIVHVVEEARRAAATREYDVFKLRHFMEHALLQVAKFLFAFFCEDLRDLAVETLFDVPVEVDKL